MTSKSAFYLLTVTSAVLAAQASVAQTFSYQSSATVTDDVIAEQTMTGTQGRSLHGILASQSDDIRVELLGQTISSSMTVDRSWTDQGTTYTFSGITAGSMKGEEGATLILGGDATEDIDVTVNVSGTGVDSSGNTVGLGAVGIWALNNYTSEQTNNGGHIEINGRNLTIDVTAKEGSAYGILAQNSTTHTTGDPSTVIIRTDNTRIEAFTPTQSGVAIVAMSQGKVDIDSNLYAAGDSAIVARGDAVLTINASGEHYTQLEGDINFNYDKDTSGTGVDADVSVYLTGENSYWNGAAVVSYGTGAAEPEDLLDVSGLNVVLADGARWNAANRQEYAEGETGLQQIAVNSLTLDGGIVNSTEAGQNVRVEALTLTENGGVFNAVTTVEEDGALTTAKLSTTSIAGTEGATPAITVNYTGIDADDLTDTNVGGLVGLVGEDGEAVADAAVTEHVEEGNIRGAWTRTNGAGAGSYADNTKLESFRGVNAVALVQWRNQINHLTKRLGDVRHQSGDIGAWARVYGGEYEWGDANRVDMQTTTVQVGGDARVGDWIVGGAFSYSDSSYDLENGDGDGDLYSLAVYGTRTFEKGSYVDFVARYGYIKNDIQAGNMDVDFDSNAFSLSVEGGHTFKLMERAYVEPQIEVTYGFAQGDDATASNGVKIEQDDYQNLITRIGFRTGFDFPNEAGTIYAHASYSYDFLGEADGTASQNGLRASLDEDLGGGWVTYGIGGQFRLGESTFAYGELERSTGGDVDNPWAFNVGFRHLF